MRKVRGGGVKGEVVHFYRILGTVLVCSNVAAALSVLGYAVGEVVASCNFDSGSSTGCNNIVFDENSEPRFEFASASQSADTGPTADHTGDNGKYSNRQCTLGVKKKNTGYCVVVRFCISDVAQCRPA